MIYHYDIPLLDDYNYLVGGFNPSEKYESQLGWWHPIYEMENKSHVWNHQPVQLFDVKWVWIAWRPDLTFIPPDDGLVGTDSHFGPKWSV